jgi:hypothetical protein
VPRALLDLKAHKDPQDQLDQQDPRAYKEIQVLLVLKEPKE